MTGEMNIVTIRRAIQAINDRQLHVIPEMVTPGFVRHDLAGAFREAGGRDGVADFLQLMLEALPDLHITIDDIFASGDRVALRITWNGTHNGKYQDIAPTGNHVTISGTNIYRFEDDKIAEAWQLYDVAGLLRQIGAITI